MAFYVVQPWGRDRYRQATVVGIHETVDAVYADLDCYADAIARDTTGEPMVFYVVDEERRPVPRPRTR